MVQIVRPEDSMAALEEMTGHQKKSCSCWACRTVKSSFALAHGLWRLQNLRPGSMDPGTEPYREISSCSNVWDFQARRMQHVVAASRTRKPVWFIP